MPFLALIIVDSCIVTKKIISTSSSVDMLADVSRSSVPDRS